MTAYRWGILGTGAIAHEFAKGLKVVPGALAHSVYSRTLDSARAFAAMYGFREAREDIESFLNDPELDIVYIATPNTSHCEHAVQCLEAGKHVLVEKPLALNVQQARRIQEAAARSQRFCMEAMWSRFMPVYQEVKGLLEQGAVGEVRFFSADFGEAKLYSPTSRLFNPELGGGALLDLGVYPISLALMFLGEPERVEGVCRKAESGVDAMSRVTLSYENGAVADLRCGFDCELPNSVWIGGTGGSVHIPGPIYRPHQYRLNQYAPQEVFEQSPGYGIRDKIQQSPGLSKLFHGLRNNLLGPFREFKQSKRVAYLANGYHYEAAEVMQALDRGETESSLMPLRDSIAVLEITDQLRRDWGIVFPGID